MTREFKPVISREAQEEAERRAAVTDLYFEISEYQSFLHEMSSRKGKSERRKKAAASIIRALKYFPEVKQEHLEHLLARTVAIRLPIENIGLLITYEHLIPKDHPIQRDLHELNIEVSVVNMFRHANLHALPHRPLRGSRRNGSQRA